MNPTLHGKRGVYSPIEQASREGRTFRVWSDTFTVGTTDPLIMTDAAFNIPANAVVFITERAAEVESTSDNANFTILRCDGENGSGNTEQIAGNTRIATGANNQGFDGDREHFVPPVVVKYSDGWRSIVLQVTAGDADVIIDASMAGYWELEA